MAEAPQTPERGHPLLAALRERGMLSEEQSAEVLTVAAEEGLPLDRAVVRGAGVEELPLLRAEGELLGLPVRESLADVPFSREFAQSVPVDFARRHCVLGLQDGEDVVILAAATALEPDIADAVSLALGTRVDVVLAPEAQINDAITRSYQQGAQIEWESEDEEDESEVARLLDAAGTDQDLLAAVESAPVVQLVNKLLFEALRARASDVHIQPTGEGVVVRYRIDGVLHPVATYPLSVLEPVVSRIKVMGRMDITERRLPQDGRTTVRLGNKNVDLRISTVPSNYGERVVVRLLDRSTGVYGLEELGLSGDHLEMMDRIVDEPNGMFFCTGPTGSGKTTTLYAALLRVDSEERNVITLEDPIEYHLSGITQLPVTEKKGMTFASGLRSILRQDPDVIMVGEVRDVETARMAVRAAQTGHLVLSTLHTNDSAGAVARLLDLGVEPFLLSSTLTAIMAQRLVRRICPDCSEPYAATPQELKGLGLEQDQEAELRRGKGCEKCLHTGFYGRLGLFELLPIDDPIRKLIVQEADAMTIRNSALERGLVTLRADGVRKVLDGKTTPGEVMRVT
ncbi:MAG: GspE/PulE family protein [Candidatus Brocadiia bacterium]